MRCCNSSRNPQIPLLTINLLQALPKTPLWDRLEREGRLVNDDDGRDSNVEFLLPYDQVVNSWRKCMEVAYQPEKLFARYQYQCDYTYAQADQGAGQSPEQKSWANIKRGLIMLKNIFWKVGVLGDYRFFFYRLPMTEFPQFPAYELAETKKYFLGSIQYSSGCPYQCEFCDIPGLYGRNPRLKTPQQIIAELDKLRECGVTGSVYFVDDNFIGNRKAALDLLPHLIEWQKRTGYVMRLACEATLNIAKRPEILEKMREAFFVTIFCGIETPDPDALKAMHKDHNMMVPILEGIHTINSYGMEVVSGIIMGLDTDKPETGDALLAFVDESRIPLLTINLLQALPKTPLWDRLEREGRLVR